MRNIYKRNFPELIEEVPESHEETLLVRLKNSQQNKKLNRDLMNVKMELLNKIYTTKDAYERKRIILTWPNELIKQLCATNDIIEMKNNSYFVGNITNNMIHGYGLMIYGPKRFYEGNFQNNYKHGEGIELLPNGIYKGSYINNKPQGKGVFYWNNQEMYQGDFLNGMKHGNGIWTSQKQTYTGEWKTNKPDGNGMIVSEDSKYQGQVRMGIKHGQGKENFKNGDTYIGGYLNGRPEGYGEYFWNANGSVFKGNFKNGLRHGHGIWMKGGDRYEGEYLNDKKNGKGVFSWSSGNNYQGSYLDDLRHGYGEMKWSDGSWYKGEWKFGVQNGLGEMLQSGQQKSRKGMFQNNVLVFEESLSKKLKMDKYYKKTSKIAALKKNDNEESKKTFEYTSPSQAESRKDQVLKKKVPVYITRKVKQIGNIARSTRNSQSEKRSQLSVESKDKEIRSTDKPLINKPEHLIKPAFTKKDWHKQLNIIQWSNIKNVETAPLILKNKRYEKQQ